MPQTSSFNPPVEHNRGIQMEVPEVLHFQSTLQLLTIFTLRHVYTRADTSVSLPVFERGLQALGDTQIKPIKGYMTYFPIDKAFLATHPYAITNPGGVICFYGATLQCCAMTLREAGVTGARQDISVDAVVKDVRSGAIYKRQDVMLTIARKTQGTRGTQNLRESEGFIR